MALAAEACFELRLRAEPARSLETLLPVKAQFARTDALIAQVV